MAVTQATTLADFTSGIGTAGAVFQVDNANNRIGIGTTNPQTLLDVDGDSTFQGNVDLLDNDRLRIGDSQDLEIYSDGVHSFIREQGPGLLFIDTNNIVNIRKNASEDIAKFNVDGAVELYYDNSKKFETTGIGVSVSNGAASTATIAAPANLVIDPAVVGDNTGLVRIKGDLFVDGTTTQINSTTLEISDFVVGIASTATTDLLTDGAGIKIGPDNTFLYEHNGGTNPSLKSSENLNVATGKVYQIGETERLSVDTLSVGTGATVHSPASNVLTVGTNNEERLRIDSSGRILIGTQTPGPTGAEQLTIEDSSNSGITIRSGTSAAGSILFEDDTADRGEIQYSHNGDFLRIKTAGSESFRIDSSGTVESNSSISSTYSTTGSITPHLRARNGSGLDNIYGGIQLRADRGTGAAAIFNIACLNSSTNYASTLVFQSRNTDGNFSEKLRIDSAGNVAIGHNSAPTKLGIRGTSASTDATVQIVGNGVSTLLLGQDAAGGVIRGQGGSNQLKFKVGGSGDDAAATGGIEALRIKSDGNIGIGTDNPGAKLQVSGYTIIGPDGTSNQYQGLSFRHGRDSSANIATGYIDFRNNLNIADAHIFADHGTDGGSTIIVGNTPPGDRTADRRIERFRIASDGSVGINSTNPTATLDVGGTIHQTVVEYPSIRPALDLNFAATKTLDRRITFTRDSVGTYYDELGNVKYASNNTPRFDHDPDTGESLGLLIEESRTNLVSYSYYQGNGSIQTSGTVNNWGLLFTSGGTANLTPGIDAPDGSNNAVRFTNLNTGSSILRINIDAFTPNGSDTYTLSFWARAISGTGGMSCDLHDGSPNGTWTDQLVTNKWVRIVKSGVPSNAYKNFIDIISNIDNNRVVDFWGLQLEKGSFGPTSYIPTSGSTVTRAVDTVVIKGTNFTDFYNASESTIFFESGVAPVTNSKYFTFHGTDGGGTELIESAAVSGPGANIFTYANSTVWSNISVTDASATTLKYAAGIKANDINLAVNGTLGTTDTSSQQPDALDKLIIGNYSSGSYYINTSIKKLSYYNKRLPNAQLQGLTYQ